MRRFALVPIGLLAATVCLSACSPYLYKAELDAFEASSTGLRAAALAQRSWEETDRRRNVEHRVRQLHARAATAEEPLPVPNLSQACMRLGSGTGSSEPGEGLEAGLEPGCHLTLLARNEAAEAAAPTDPDAAFTSSLVRANQELEWSSAYPQIEPLLQALSDYASGLAALTNASDAESLEEAQSTLAAGIGGLVSTVGHSSETNDRDALGRALANTAGTFWRARLDRRRLETLRAAVNEADRVLGDIAPPITLYLDDVRVRQLVRERRDLMTEILEANRRLSSGPTSEDAYAALILTLDQKTFDFAARAQVSPARAFERLVEAHHALREAVDDEGRQFAASTRALAGFVEALNEVEAAIEAYRGEETTND